MAITTYSELKAAIADWCPRSDVSTKADEFIDLAESMLKRPPQQSASKKLGGVRLNKTRATGSLSSGTDTLSLPSDFLELDRLMLTADQLILVPVSPDHLGVKKRTGTGRPVFYAVADVIEFDVAPDDSYAYSLSYWPYVSSLSDSNTTNFLITNYPDVYLAACMYWCWSYFMDNEQMALWAGRYAEGAAMVNQTYARRLSQGSLQIQNAGSTP